MEKADTRAKGRQGEQMASEYLEKIGFQIIEKNYRNRFGEMDIIAVEGKYLVFIEVKMRNLITYGHPAVAVDTWKQIRLSKIAAGYIIEKKQTDKPCRFDVVSIYKGKIELIRDAFELTDHLSW